MPIDIKSLAIGKKNGGGGGGDITTEKLSVTKNGTYPAPSGKAYTPVVVNVPTPKLETLNVTENGSYEAESGKGYNKVNVEVETYPEPSGTKTITTNGTHDVKSFATAEVSVKPQYRVSGSTLYIGGMVEDEVLYL